MEEKREINSEFEVKSIQLQKYLSRGFCLHIRRLWVEGQSNFERGRFNSRGRR